MLACQYNINSRSSYLFDIFQIGFGGVSGRASCHSISGCFLFLPFPPFLPFPRLPCIQLLLPPESSAALHAQSKRRIPNSPTGSIPQEWNYLHSGTLLKEEVRPKTHRMLALLKGRSHCAKFAHISEVGAAAAKKNFNDGSLRPQSNRRGVAL